MLPVPAYFDFPPGYDPLAFNTYRLSGGGGFATLTINGVAVFSNAAFTPVFGSQLLFGDGTFLGNADGRIRSLEFSSGAVPEPASWALMIAGFGAVGVAARRRRVAAA
ncbi:PEP-CTERM sorting domain-containing protein [Glacieibacterium frigidum]|uniref:PEP-CTERM sorting domain-containing protein n=2 Tax=Glacieibacterium frigidum TaxID=2593303 RepID=A0A552UAP8_9SPHN|nr:PEP-CTERM sorting domain-containing protein [Glacieibacterium frigidum]